MRHIKLFESFLNEEADIFKRGAVYKDAEGKLWVFFTRIWTYDSVGGKPHSTKDKNKARFIPMEDFKPGMLSAMYGSVKPTIKEIPLAGLVKVADSVKKMQASDSGVDVELISMLKKLTKAFSQIKEEDYSYDVSFFYGRLVAANRALQLLETEASRNAMSIVSIISSLVKDLNNASREDLKNRIDNATDLTKAEIKKIYPSFNKAFLEFLENPYFKMDYILASEFGKNFKERETEEVRFVKYVIQKNRLLSQLDPYKKGVEIDIVVPVKQGGEESSRGSIVYFHAELNGTVKIDGKEYQESMSDDKRSGGWNYND